MKKQPFTSLKKAYKMIFLLLLILGLALAAVSCKEEPDDSDTVIPPDDDPVGKPGEGGGGEEPVDYAELGVNELGQIMVLMYHEIAATESEWVRTPENFRKDLKALYDAGYRAVSMNDVLDGKINIPAGTTPVVFTFDDGRAGQFRYLEKDGERIIDPDCAVGIMEAFYEEYPDFGLAATFYLFYSGVPFVQAEYVQQKFEYLVERGFEIGNHTNSHPMLRKLSVEAAQKDIALMVKHTQEYLPGYPVRSLALPYGSHPDDMSHIIAGSYEGTRYHNEGILLVGSNPAPSPFSKSFIASKIPRIRASEMLTAGTGVYEWMQRADWPRYISDGNPDTVVVPEALKEQVDEERLKGKELITY
jgi:peptidoglycan/xylan/chitin deacetylase (PgdA/CDA1 family)